MERLLFFILLHSCIYAQATSDIQNQSETSDWFVSTVGKEVANFQTSKNQNKLQVKQFDWPVGSEIQDIDNRLVVYRDFRSYNQFLLIYNQTKNILLLKDVRGNSKEHAVIPMWLVPARNIAVLLIKQESVELMCIEKFDAGERRAKCNGLIRAALLPDTMVKDINTPWLGNFSSIHELDISFRKMGIHLVL